VLLGKQGPAQLPVNVKTIVAMYVPGIKPCGKALTVIRSEAGPCIGRESHLSAPLGPVSYTIDALNPVISDELAPLIPTCADRDPPDGNIRVAGVTEGAGRSVPC
jgi:hypothetical protein